MKTQCPNVKEINGELYYGHIYNMSQEGAQNLTGWASHQGWEMATVKHNRHWDVYSKLYKDKDGNYNTKEKTNA